PLVALAPLMRNEPRGLVEPGTREQADHSARVQPVSPIHDPLAPRTSTRDRAVVDPATLPAHVSTARATPIGHAADDTPTCSSSRRFQAGLHDPRGPQLLCESAEPWK